MNSDIFDTKERIKVVAKDILAALELAKHPNFTYIPSMQLQAILSEHEVAALVVNLKEQEAVDIDERRMYLGGRINPQSSYEIRIANIQTLTLLAHPELLTKDVRVLGYKSKQKSQLTAYKVDIHRPLEPRHYADKTGVLTVSPTVDIAIAARGKVRRSNGKKYDQCHLMSCLFKSVNTINKGVPFSMFLGVKYDKNNKIHTRKIRNTIDEINRKVSDKTTAKRLILIQKEKIFIDKSYLLE